MCKAQAIIDELVSIGKIGTNGLATSDARWEKVWDVIPFVDDLHLWSGMPLP